MANVLLIQVQLRCGFTLTRNWKGQQHALGKIERWVWNYFCKGSSSFPQNSRCLVIPFGHLISSTKKEGTVNVKSPDESYLGGALAWESHDEWKSFISLYEAQVTASCKRE